MENLVVILAVTHIVFITMMTKFKIWYLAWLYTEQQCMYMEMHSIGNIFIIFYCLPNFVLVCRIVFK